MFYVICNILYYIGLIVGGLALFGIAVRMLNIIEFELITKKEINRKEGVYAEN